MMNNYLVLMNEVLAKGDSRKDRTGIGTKALFGTMLQFDLADGFPAVTTKKLFFKSIASELAGFLEGTSSAARMRELGTSIWDANANSDYWQNNPNCSGPDDMGRVYGVQWRNWISMHSKPIDQLRDVVNRIKHNPTDRRLLVSAWNPGEIDLMCLPPCHYAFQFFIREGCYVDILVHMRSVDIFLGMPFDIASYALLLHIVAREIGLHAGILTMTFGDTHLYNSHTDQAILQLSRTPLKLPLLALSDECTGIDAFKPEYAELVDYKHHPFIKANMAV